MIERLNYQHIKISCPRILFNRVDDKIMSMHLIMNNNCFINSSELNVLMVIILHPSDFRIIRVLSVNNYPTLLLISECVYGSCIEEDFVCYM